MTLQRALLLLIGGAFVLALAPAGVLLDRRLETELSERSIESLALAPMVLDDRNRSRSETLSMHAKDLAEIEGLGDALERGDRTGALGLLQASPPYPGESPLLVDPEGSVLLGPDPDTELVGQTRSGVMPVGYVFSDDTPQFVALAPVETTGGWMGAAGVAAPFDGSVIETLAGLTRSAVTVLGPSGTVSETSLDPTLARALAEHAATLDSDAVERVYVEEDGDHWVVTAPLGTVGTVLFSRSVSDELAALPGLRRSALLAGALGLLFALVVGAMLATRVSRPVGSLAAAADRLGDGDFEVELPQSSIREIGRVSDAFGEMRRALASKLEELEGANQALEDRQNRLTALQSELIQRDRLEMSGRLVAELAHEIRNPVANVRNLLEVLRRRMTDDPEGREFADLAVEELLRMHGLAEQLLDVNRPSDPEVRTSAVSEIVHQIAAIGRAGNPERKRTLTVSVEESELAAAIAPDALKQVLLNLVENARDATPETGTIEISARTAGDEIRIEVTDDGPGIADDVISRVFDPFFTTKGSVQGVGLGLFVAQGIIRRYGGRLEVENRDEDREGSTGARFRMTLPAAFPEAARPVESADA